MTRAHDERASSPLDRAAAVVRDAVDAPDLGARHAVERARLVRAATAPRRSGAARGALAVAVVAIAAIAGGAVAKLGANARERALTFEVGADRAVGAVGAYYAPFGDLEAALRFSDGSVVALEPHARARVTSTDAHGAAVLVEQGKARFDVRHLDGTTWTVAVGPYSVRVVGTQFSAAWDASSRRVEVEVVQGRVRVVGPGAEAGVEVGDRERFVSSATGSVEKVPALVPAPPADPARPEPASPPSAVAVAVAVPPAVGAAPARSSAAAAASAAPGGLHTVFPDSAAPPAATSAGWGALAARGAFADVVADAESRGVDTVVASAGADDLATLADAARFTGKASVARAALGALRSRFAGSSRAATAAFLLGRMADDSGQSGSALAWYDRYLAEAPGGSFVAEAAGRRVVALRRSGDSAAAAAAASDYLRRWPNGGYARVARELAAP